MKRSFTCLCTTGTFLPQFPLWLAGLVVLFHAVLQILWKCNVKYFVFLCHAPYTTNNFMFLHLNFPGENKTIDTRVAQQGLTTCKWPSQWSTPCPAIPLMILTIASFPAFLFASTFVPVIMHSNST